MLALLIKSRAYWIIIKPRVDHSVIIPEWSKMDLQTFNGCLCVSVSAFPIKGYRKKLEAKNPFPKYSKPMGALMAYCMGFKRQQ